MVFDKEGLIILYFNGKYICFSRIGDSDYYTIHESHLPIPFWRFNDIIEFKMYSDSGSPKFSKKSLMIFKDLLKSIGEDNEDNML